MKHAFSLILFSAIVGLLFTGIAATSTALEAHAPLFRVVDLNIGETTSITLHDDTTVSITFVALEEHQERVRQAVYGSTLQLKVNGNCVALDAGPYRLPITVAGIQIDCTVTKGLNTAGTPAFWGLNKDARIRLWPADSPLLRPDTMIYPVKQGWNATRTWFDNEPVHGGATIKKAIYYHAGMDIGASEGLVEVIAATDALVVQRGMDVLEGHAEDRPTSPRGDVVYLLDGRGWYYRYSHLKEIAPNVQLGTLIKQGDPVGIVGKEGASGGWSHLHFEIKSRQPSGKWGTQAAFGFLHEAYVNEFGLKLYANARPAQMIVAGERAILDGSRSWSADDSIVHYEWILNDGSTMPGDIVSPAYDTPGSYCETLKLSDQHGNTAYDFAYVMVLDPDDLTHYAPSLNINHHPSRNIKVGDEITFKVRAFGMKGGTETWDFGDGSVPQSTQSSKDTKPHAPDGYAELTHRYAQPGDYIVTVRRSHANGQLATAKTWVHVTAQEQRQRSRP